jgi:hypothetical protein
VPIVERIEHHHLAVLGGLFKLSVEGTAERDKHSHVKGTKVSEERSVYEVVVHGEVARGIVGLRMHAQRREKESARDDLSRVC